MRYGRYNGLLDSSDCAIRLHGISKWFPQPRGGRLDVLENISLQIRSGEIMGVMGANGAGKTTLLDIVATTQLPSGGTGSIGGYDLVAQAQQVRNVVGYCASNPDSFYPRLTCGANLRFFAALKNLSPKEARKPTVDDCHQSCYSPAQVYHHGAPTAGDTGVHHAV